MNRNKKTSKNTASHKREEKPPPKQSNLPSSMNCSTDSMESGQLKPKPVLQLKSPKKVRSLIGLDGESDMDDEPGGEHGKRLPFLTRKPQPQKTKHKPDSGSNESLLDNGQQQQMEKFRQLFKEYANRSQKIGFNQIEEEFSSLPGAPNVDECKQFNHPVNARKNRYTNIPCLDVSRVKLHFLVPKNEPGHDYIHANYVTSRYLRNQRYILTQGPKTRTVVDFWRMVWQERTTTIVMLCQFQENNREKCVEYFPLTAENVFRFDGGFNLRFIETTRSRTVVTTKLRLEYRGETRNIKHLQWTEWPDYHIPDSSEVILKLLKKIREKKTPPVIHCAAGVGRSGTFMAIEIALMQINNFYEPPDIRRIVEELRIGGRCLAVQTVQQYMIIRKVVLDFGATNRLVQMADYTNYSSLTQNQAAQSPVTY